jgi:hypothetical protein
VDIQVKEEQYEGKAISISGHVNRFTGWVKSSHSLRPTCTDTSAGTGTSASTSA